MIENEHDIKQGILLFKCVTGYQGKPSLLNGDYTYIIYRDDINIGSLHHTNYIEWYLSIPGAEINLHGQYRNDLVQEAEMLYRKFLGDKK
jgi:hypothetical protein